MQSNASDAASGGAPAPAADAPKPWEAPAWRAHCAQEREAARQVKPYESDLVESLAARFGIRFQIDRYEVSVPGSDFFTTYAVSERVYAELCHIAKVRPRLGEVLREADGWLESLLRIGVLRLEPTPPLQEEITPTDALDIVEQATKTTPTCLSSYLG